MMENNKIKPPEYVVIREVLIPFQRIYGEIIEISGTALNILPIPTAVAIIPKIAVNEPMRIILSKW